MTLVVASIVSPVHDGRHKRFHRARDQHYRMPGPEGYARASWFNDGATACGTHHRFGFASRSYLPSGRRAWCGMRVRFYYRGRKVIGTRDDYGPATWTGRDFDFLPGLNSALGYSTDARVGWRVVK